MGAIAQPSTDKVSVGATKLSQEALQNATAQLVDATLELKRRRELRNDNLSKAGYSESKALDSSVKRNSALIKKLRQLSDESRESLLTDLQKTNQSKYVSEAVTAITEANLKSKDINAAVQICSALHQRYPDFQSELIAALSRTAAPKADEEKATAIKRRSAFKLLTELLLVGVYTDAAVLLTAVKSLASVDFHRDRETAQSALSLLASFAKSCREDILGLPNQAFSALSLQDADERVDGSTAKGGHNAFATAKAEYLAETEQRFVLSSAKQQDFCLTVAKVFGTACQQLEVDHKGLIDADKENSRVLNNRGELPDDMSASYERQRKAYEALQRAVASLADTMEKSMPDLPEPSSVTRTKDGGIVVLTGREADDGATAGPFEDEDTRAFYESLPDVRAVVPAVLLGETAPADAPDQMTGSLVDGSNTTMPHAPASDNVDFDAEGIADDDNAAGDTEALGGAKTKAAVDALLSQLPKCISRDLCDELSVNFCYLNSKAARKRLVRTLCESNHRSNLQLLPFYCRVAATLSQVFPDVGLAVLKTQEEEFNYLQAKKDPTLRTLEARLRNARYLGELVKFRLAPFGTIFVMLKSLLDDFVQHNVDTACGLLETAGRFLYRLPETHTRMANMAEVMMKQKNNRNLDARQSMLVESAYYQCNPPQHSALKRKKRPVIQDWMRHLVFVQLGKDDVRKVLRKLRKLSWAENEAYLVRVLLKAVKGRFSQVPQVASLASGLSRYHPSMGVAFVDALLEEVRCGLESPDSGTYQQRVGHMRLLGEMYNFRLVDSRVVFDTLYLLLSFGHESTEETERLDPPFSYFRIRLVCSLLETCGQFFNKGLAKKRLDRFLAFYQRYLLAKPPLPLDVEFDVQDLLAHLRPSLERLTSFEQAAQAVAAIEASEARSCAAGPAGLGAIEEEDSDTDDSADNSGSNSDDEGRGGRGAADEDDGSNAAMTDQDDDDDHVKLLNPVKIEEVDEDFEKELAALMTDFKLPPSGPFPQARPDSPAGSSQQDPGSTVSFRVMMKRGGRDDRSKAVQLPVNSSVAVNMRAKAEAEEQERAEMKRLVLQSHQQDSFDYVPIPKVVLPHSRPGIKANAVLQFLQVCKSLSEASSDDFTADSRFLSFLS
ncbi:hypothetical protein WJX79_005678 [Trebouxia sp. C0005]